MKYTRFEYKDINTINHKRAILKYYLWIPFVVILAGYAISKFIIVPHILSSGLEHIPVSDSKPVYSYQDINSKKYNVLQMGAFASKANVEAFALNLRKNGIPAYVNYENQLYYVIVFCSTDQNYTMDMSAYYESSGYSCIAKVLNISPKTVPDNQKKEQGIIAFSNIYNAFGKAVDGCLEAFNLFQKGSIGYIELNKNVKSSCSGFHQLVNLSRKDGLVLQQKNIIDGLLSIDKLLQDMELLNESPSFKTEFNEKLIEAVYRYKELSCSTEDLY